MNVTEEEQEEKEEDPAWKRNLPLVDTRASLWLNPHLCLDNDKVSFLMSARVFTRVSHLLSRSTQIALSSCVPLCPLPVCVWAMFGSSEREE